MCFHFQFVTRSTEEERGLHGTAQHGTAQQHGALMSMLHDQNPVTGAGMSAYLPGWCQGAVHVKQTQDVSVR